jgi:hypothetical protein
MYHLAFSYRFPDLGVSEKVAAGTKPETKTVPRKRNNSSDSVQVSKKRKKSRTHYSKSHHKNEVNGVKTVFTTISSDSSEERSRANHKPGPKSRVRPQQASVNAKVKVKEPKQKNEMKYKSAPKSQVAGKNDDLDSDNSDVEFILYKPPDSFLDVIDLTDAVESPVESEHGSGTEEAIEPHIELTKIPGIGKIYTCPVCEGTFTSSSCANKHVCMVNIRIPMSPTEVDLREKTIGEETSKNKVPGEMASENKAGGNGTSEGVAAGQKASETKTHECGERHNAESTSSEHIFSTSSNVSSVLQRILSETKGFESGNENGSENDTSSAGFGSHVCDICGFRCTRLVSLASHKDRHLYPMNECEEDSIDCALFNVRKKKKRAPKPVTENE